MIFLINTKNFLKIIAIFLLAVLFLVPVFAYACDYDGVCEPSETKDNCVFDCLVATNQKEVKIALFNNTTAKITRFDINNNPTIITDGPTIFSFLVTGYFSSKESA